jgi:hypothetical protein
LNPDVARHSNRFWLKVGARGPGCRVSDLALVAWTICSAVFHDSFGIPVEL